MDILPNCPKCTSEYVYLDREMYICPECSYEWAEEKHENSNILKSEALVVRDFNGNFLKDGDYVTAIKDLKIKGSSAVVKVGTKIKILKIVDGDHNIDCKVDGIGAISLKSEFVKKAKDK